MYVIHAIGRTFEAGFGVCGWFLYGNWRTRAALFSDGSHMGTKVPIQLPFWGGVSPLQPARSAAVCPLIRILVRKNGDHAELWPHFWSRAANSTNGNVYS